MTDTIAVLQPVVECPDSISLFDLCKAVYSLIAWTLFMPIVFFHELAHVIAAMAFGYNFAGAGVAYEYAGTVSGFKIPRIRAFFVVSEPIPDSKISTIVSLAPFGWIVIAITTSIDGAPIYISLFWVIVAVTGISDLWQIWGPGPISPHLTKRFIFGGPDQWQLTLNEYK